MEIQVVSPGAIVGPESSLMIPDGSKQVVASAHLGVVLLKECKGVSSREVVDYTLGYTICIRLRTEVHDKDTRGFTNFWSDNGDKSLAIGPYVVMKDLIDPSRVRVTLYLNDEEILQDFDTSSLCVSAPRLIAKLSRRTTLPAGTLILTGTKHTEISLKTPVAAGDVLSASCQGIGTLRCQLTTLTEGVSEGRSSGGAATTTANTSNGVQQPSNQKLNDKVLHAPHSPQRCATTETE